MSENYAFPGVLPWYRLYVAVEEEGQEQRYTVLPS